MSQNRIRRFNGLFVDHVVDRAADPAPPMVNAIDRRQVLTNERRPAPLRDHIERLVREAQSEEPIR